MTYDKETLTSRENLTGAILFEVLYNFQNSHFVGKCRLIASNANRHFPKNTKNTKKLDVFIDTAVFYFYEKH
ncbi:MAG: hypothetical protein MR694_01340 [Spirochaetia bacterium]|nr:hypothetical protein [Spirochaetia bacterium]